METDQRKRKHHKLPQLYLKGFVEKEGEPFIWVYRRGIAYNPGRARYKYNPYLDSIRFVGAEKDYYAYTDEAGNTDYDTYENILEKKEKPADPIFAKLRSHQMISEGEKKVFASYMLMMLRRVPRGKERAKQIWPKIVDEFETSSELMQWIKLQEATIKSTDTEKEAKLIRLRKKIQEILADRRENIPSQILLNLMVGESALPVHLCSMTWQFLTAPEGMSFITGDNPVFFFESFGLNKPYSEVIFPVSTDIVLAASKHKELKEGFFPATSATVKEANRRIASVATTEVYSSRKVKWVLDVLNKKSHRFNLLYPYTESTP